MLWQRQNVEFREKVEQLGTSQLTPTAPVIEKGFVAFLDVDISRFVEQLDKRISIQAGLVRPSAYRIGVRSKPIMWYN
jgi:hypothetical protein